MPVRINSEDIKKLYHVNDEIRLRTFQQIEGKILRCLSFNENIQYDSGFLIHYLIRWFQAKPLLEESRLLKLIFTVLQSEKGPDAIEYHGKERLLKEMDKISYIAKSSPSQESISEIKNLLHNFDEGNDVIEISDSDNSITNEETVVRKYPSDEISEDFELPWSLPTTVDYNSLKKLCEILDLESYTEKNRKTVKLLKFKIYDYPAEFFLQPPFMVNSLLNIVTNERETLSDALDSIINITTSISSRVKVRSLSSMFQSRNEEVLLTRGKIQISIKRYCEDVLSACIEYLKSSVFDFNLNIYKAIQIIYNVSSLLTQTTEDRGSMKKHLIDLCFITYKIRHSNKFDNFVCRSKYMLLLFFIAKMSKREKFEDEHFKLSCISEMQAAVFDMPLKKLFPAQHKTIELLASLNEKPILKELYNIEDFIGSVVKLLRSCDKIDDEEMLQLSQNAMQSLDIYDSLDLIKRFHLAIINCIPLYLKDNNLKQIAQKLLLFLFANENLTFKKYVYKESANVIKKYFAALMEGCASYQKVSITQLAEAQIIGIPLTTELIVEIICFGCYHQDSTISKNAELILSLILKCKTFLTAHWQFILEIIIPNLALFQSLPFESNLTKIVMDLLDPDVASDLSILEIFKGNLRYLFHSNSGIRSEALSRLVYMSQANDPNNRYKPNVLEISDTLPNDICCLNFQRDPKQILYGKNIYEKSTVINLIEILKSPGAAPDIRKTVLTQLNVICQDEHMNQFISNENGWYYAMQALESSLMVNSINDYTDSAIPAIGIISKLAISDQRFRRELSKEATVYMLVLRALFEFQHDVTLQPDASMLIFLLANSEFVVGNRRMTVPKIFQNLQLPINFAYHWNETPFSVKSTIEMAYDSYKNDVDAPCLQFIRMKFAELWFDDITMVLHNNNHSDYFKTIQQMYTKKSSTYLEFSNKLYLTERDIKKLKNSSPISNIKRCLNSIANATEPNAVITNFHYIQLFLLLKTKEKRIEDQQIIEIFRKFILLPSTSQLDYLLFSNCAELFICLVDAGYNGVVKLIANTLQSNQNIFKTLLRQRSLDVLIYEKICTLIKKVILQYNDMLKNETAIVSQVKSSEANVSKPLLSKKSKRRTTIHTKPKEPLQHNYEFIDDLFTYCLEMAEICCTKRNFDHLRCLLNVLLAISQKFGNLIQYPRNKNSCMKFINFTTEIRSKTQIGSDIIKQCLWIVGNLSEHAIKFGLDEKYKLVMPLCGHCDVEVRVLAWCILKKIVESTDSIDQINSYFESYLGSKGYCISIFLDENEIPCVRSIVGDIFSTLISSSGDNESIMKIFNKHKFLESMNESLANYYPLELIDKNYPKGNITTCEIIRTYCKILITSVSVRKTSDHLDEMSILLKFSDIIKQQTIITETFIEMSAEICNLFICLNFINSQDISHVLCQDQHFIESICKLITIKSKDKCFLSFIKLIMILSKNSIWVYQIVCNYFDNQSKLNDLVQLLMHFIFNNNSDKLIQITCISFFSFFINLSVSLRIDQPTFAYILDKKPHSNQPSFAEYFFIAFDKLFHQYYILKTHNFREQPSSIQIVLCEAMAVLLKSTETSRNAAQRRNFLGKLIHILKKFFENFEITCTTFVRRYGDSKKLPILKNLSILYCIILNWFHMDILTDEQQTLQLSKLIIHTWPWISHSFDLKVILLKTIMFLTETSIPMCKQIATNSLGNSNSVLILVMNLVTIETNKIKHQNVEESILAIGLRILGICCSCQEGRSLMIKSHILDVFDRFYPLDQKMQKYQMNTIKMWLVFWELLSRYQEGATCRHLVVITSLIQISNDIVRILCLKILRNMAFLTTNRTVLFSSNDYLCTTNSVLASGTDEEKLIVCTGIWKLIAGHCKSKVSIKNTSISKRIKNIHDDIINNNKDYKNNDLFTVVEIILKILYD